MRIYIDHETTYRYSETTNYAVQCLRLTPRNFRGQHVVNWQVDVTPHSSVSSGVDPFGNITQHIYVSRPFEEMRVRVRGLVMTNCSDGIVAGTPEPFPPDFYLRETELTQPSDELKRMACKALIEGDGSQIGLAHTLMGLLRDRMDYRTGVTGVTTTGAKAFEAGHGVCQDHAHAFIAAARYLKLPARYVSGYLMSGIAEEASHAWAEVHIKDLGWVGFDAANRICPTEAYVRVAAGPDYMSAGPARGMRRGFGEEDMEVRVNVLQEQGAQQ